MDYLKFFGLAEQPFSNAPDNRFYYDSPQHSKAILKLSHAAEMMKGLAVVLGDIGTGKTTVSRRMLEILPDDQYETGLLVIVHSEVSPGWLISKIAQQMGVEKPADTKAGMVGQLYEQLMRIYNDGRKAVLIIDEANMLKSKEIMEEMRGLLNMEISGSMLITFLLFGLPDLEHQRRHRALDPGDRSQEQHHVAGPEPGEQRGPARSPVADHPQPRREARELGRPVGRDRQRRDHERRPLAGPAAQERDGLHGLAELHVVGQHLNPGEVRVGDASEPDEAAAFHRGELA